MTKPFKTLIDEATKKLASYWDNNNNVESEFYCTASFKQGAQLPNELLIMALEKIEQTHKYLSSGNDGEGWQLELFLLEVRKKLEGVSK